MIEEVIRRQAKWSNRLAAGLTVEAIEEALTVMRMLRQRGEAAFGAPSVLLCPAAVMVATIKPNGEKPKQ